MAEKHWHYNQHAERWECDISDWHAIVTPDLELVTYTAMIEPPDKSCPIELAPHAFEMLQEAQSWCEQEIYNRTHIYEQIQAALNGSASMRTPPPEERA